MNWLQQEEEYLSNIKTSSLSLSQSFHKVYFRKKKIQTKLRIPAIIIGSFTGVASFGTSTFPTFMQRWVAVIVGLVNIGIAVLNTVESFFKISEDMTAAKSTSEQLRKLAEDIDRELALPQIDRETSGIIFLRDAYTRYQQILNQAPMLARYISHADKNSLNFTLPYSGGSSRRTSKDHLVILKNYLKKKGSKTATEKEQEAVKDINQLEPYVNSDNSSAENNVVPKTSSVNEIIVKVQQ